MKKGDIIIGVLLVLIAVISFLFVQRLGDNNTSLRAVIKVDGELYKEIKLQDNYNNFIEINSNLGYNKIDIQGKTVKITHSDCQDKLCIKQESISKPFESIVCLPARLIVYIEGDTELDYVSY